MIQPQDARVGRLFAQSPGDVELQGDLLLEYAKEAFAEQSALLEATPLESQFGAAFAAQVEAKRDQAERLEDRLEVLIEQQAVRIQRTLASQPGLLSLPRTRTKWQAQVQLQQSTMERLHARLESVREIKDGMGIHAPRIEELATRKLRAEQPDLAKEWDEMREAARRHQSLKRQKEKKMAAGEGRREEGGRRLGLSESLKD